MDDAEGTDAERQGVHISFFLTQTRSPCHPLQGDRRESLRDSRPRATERDRQAENDSPEQERDQEEDGTPKKKKQKKGGDKKAAFPTIVTHYVSWKPLDLSILVLGKTRKFPYKVPFLAEVPRASFDPGAQPSVDGRGTVECLRSRCEWELAGSLVVGPADEVPTTADENKKVQAKKSAVGLFALL